MPLCSVVQVKRNEKSNAEGAQEVIKKHLYLFPVFYLFSLGIIAPSFLKLHGDNRLVITLLISVIIYAVFLFWNKPRSSYAYPLALFTISLSILYCFNSRSNHVFGNDIHLEYYEFRLTSESAQWAPRSLYSSCLSITVLPTIFSYITGLDGELIFKFMYTFLWSLVPVILHKLYAKWIGKNMSFAITLFFIASSIYFLHIRLGGSSSEFCFS